MLCNTLEVANANNTNSSCVKFMHSCHIHPSRTKPITPPIQSLFDNGQYGEGNLGGIWSPRKVGVKGTLRIYLKSGCICAAYIAELSGLTGQSSSKINSLLSSSMFHLLRFCLCFIVWELLKLWVCARTSCVTHTCIHIPYQAHSRFSLVPRPTPLFALQLNLRWQ